jgi:hypothetical protein
MARRIRSTGGVEQYVDRQSTARRNTIADDTILGATVRPGVIRMVPVEPSLDDLREFYDRVFAAVA